MMRGMTLLELITLVAVVVLLAMAGMPALSQAIEKSKMINLANQVQGMLRQAKSQAVFTNQPIWFHFSIQPNSSQYSGRWRMSLQNSSVSVQYHNALNNALYFLDGGEFININVLSTSNFRTIKFDAINGKPIGVGSSFSFYIDANKVLKISIHNITGRIRVCGYSLLSSPNNDYYGYPSC